jgi:hypothetical protein
MIIPVTAGFSLRRTGETPVPPSLRASGIEMQKVKFYYVSPACIGLLSSQAEIGDEKSKPTGWKPVPPKTDHWQLTTDY